MKLHTERFGAGPPLVVLHGLLGSGDNWMGLAKNWAQQYTVLIPDLRNHGRSPHAEQTGLDVMAQDVAELLGESGFSSAVILGHSLGGKVAMRVAMDFPQLVNGLIVVDIAPRPYPPAHLSILQALLAVDLGKHSNRTTIDQELSATILEAPVRQWLMKNLGRDATGNFYWKPNLPVLLRDLRELSGGFSDSNEFAKPSLFIRGGRSRYVTDDDVVAIKRFFPKAELATIPEAGHWVHADAPVQISQLIEKFMSERSED